MGNRKTLGWSAAAATFAYGFGRMASLGYKFVGADQLIAGPWPDNEPAVASLDWDTGEPNAKYWAVRMLAELGIGPKKLFNATVTGSDSSVDVYALAMELEGGERKVLLVSKTHEPQNVHIVGGEQAVAYILEGVGDEPGFVPPASRSLDSNAELMLGPYGVALVTLPSDGLLV